MRLVAATVVVALLLGSAPFAEAQTVSATESAYKAEVVRRLSAVAAYLDSQSQRAASLAKTVRIASSASTSSLLRRSISQGDAVAEDLGRMQPIAQELELVRPSRSTEFKEVAASQADAESAKVAAYSASVKHLIEQIKAAPPEDVQSLMEEAGLPLSTAIVIDPGHYVSPLPPGASQAGDSSAFHLILSGAATVDYPAVAAILSRDPGGGLSTSCTGTLIAPNAVLTAAHCVTGSAFPVEVYFQHAGIFTIATKVPNPTFPQGPVVSYPTAGDIAVIILSADVTGITPLALNETAAVAPGTVGVIVGFGWHSGPKLADATGALNGLVAKAGIKLFADTTTSVCSGAAVGKNQICWIYQNGPLVALQGSTCFGDSGGPFAIFEGAGWKLAGVTSSASTCQPGDRAYDTEVYPYVGWINSVLARYPPSNAAPTLTNALQPMTNDPSTYPVDASDRTFDPSQAAWSRAFSVDSDVKTLRIAINSTPSGAALGLSASPNNGTSACSQTDDDTVIFCNVSPANAGAWTVSVHGVPQQEFQLVATEFR